MNLSINDTPLPRTRAEDFMQGEPFPLVVLDRFLPEPVAQALMGEIGRLQDLQRSNDYIFAKNKFEQPAIESLGPAAAALHALLVSSEFAGELSRLYKRPLLVDPNFLGGGVHRGGEGSFLDMHVDFARHPRHRDWIRELNILLYLNPDWRPEFGGQLNLRHGETGATRSIDPLWNRMVIMLTKGFTFHGYKPINFPAGTYRTSVAAYAYSVARDGEDLSHLRTTTTWAPEGATMKAAVARVVPALVSLKQRLLGSSTARKSGRQK